MGYNSGLSSTQDVNITGGSTNLPVPATGQTIITGTCRSQAGAATTLITTTAGKTFYCLGVMLNCGGVSSAMHVDVDGVEKIGLVLPVNGVVCLTGGILFSCPATKAVTVVSDQAGKSCTVWGFEQ